MLLALLLCIWMNSQVSGRTSPIRRGFRQGGESPDHLNLTFLSTPNPLSEERQRASLELSRNMSITLENLLRDYDHHQRPGHGDSPTIVTTNMLIRSMGPISELDMAYSMDCYFRQMWTDRRLQFEGPVNNLSLNIKMLEKLWKPDTYFHNGKGSYLHTITRPNKLLRILRNGEILYSMRLTVKARCPMSLHYFPMDIQSCPLIFGSYGYPLSEMEYRWDAKDPVSLNEGQFMSQFDLINFPYRNTTVSFRRGMDPNGILGVYSALQVNFNLRRHTGYFLIQVYVPCILIVVLSWVSFWINREATADRIGLGITTVLTLSTFVLDTKTDLPKVSYPTALDWFVIMSFVFVISTLLEFAGVHYFTKVGSGEFLGAADPNNIKNPDDSTTESMKNSDGFEDSDVDEVVQELRYLKTENKPELWGNLCHPENNQVAGYHGSQTVPVSKCRVGHNSGTGVTLPVYPAPHHAHRHVKKRRREACCFQLYKCILGSQQYRDAMRRRAPEGTVVNSVSKIDEMSRIFFPLSFIMLNLFYWFSYTRAAISVPWEE